MADATIFVVCSECFRDQGLRIDAHRIGDIYEAACPNCGVSSGRKLDEEKLASLVHKYFVWGSLFRCAYGAAPLIQFNEHQGTSVTFPEWLRDDVQLIESILGVGFFHYGPRLWMIGEVEPLKNLADPEKSGSVIERILYEYPGRLLRPEDAFYRVRKGANHPDEPREYDSPPPSCIGKGRLESDGFPVMYASPDLQVCVHECRVTAEEDVYVASLNPVSTLRFLDLSALLTHEDVTEFESLDMAVHMLFLAGAHSYPIARSIARAARDAGFDGLIFPSYFSLLRLGVMPFETVYGISHRRVPSFQELEQTKTVPNLAVFGRPIEEQKVEVKSIDKITLRRVEYDIHFGPVGFA